MGKRCLFVLQRGGGKSPSLSPLSMFRVGYFFKKSHITILYLPFVLERLSPIFPPCGIVAKKSTLTGTNGTASIPPKMKCSFSPRLFPHTFSQVVSSPTPKLAFPPQWSSFPLNTSIFCIWYCFAM